MTPNEEDDEGDAEPPGVSWAYHFILTNHHDALRRLQTSLQAPHMTPIPDPQQSELEAHLGEAVQALDDALRTLEPPDE